MRFSRLFGRTMRDAPSDSEMVSHQLSVRAGLVRQMASGIYSYLPTGRRVLARIAQIIREEMDGIDGQEILMPVVQPAKLWRTTGRYDAPSPGPALVRFQDRSGQEMVLAMTHEEAVTDLARQEIRSYRQLPLLVYQIQTKFRDEPRPRAGLIRVREFMMKDGYSFHADGASLSETYDQLYQAYLRIAERCGLAVLPVEASSGMMGGSDSHEFMCLSDAGEDTIITCPACGYAANMEAARFGMKAKPRQAELPLTKVATPGTTTITALSELLGVTASQTLKAVFYSSDRNEIIFAVIRGDLEVNQSKLEALLGGHKLQPASEEQLAQAGLVAGYASPVGVTGVQVVGDSSIRSGANWVAGANEPGYHYVNCNIPRDFALDLEGDIALAQDGAPCPHCDSTLVMRRGIEVGHIFKLGRRYSEAMGMSYLDEAGRPQTPTMGCYGIGLGRLLACIIEQHHDEHGIVWPPSVAPYDVHLVALGGRDPAVDEAAETLYANLRQAGFEVLFDDRSERAGVKFNDADLIGAPLRLTVSSRTVGQGKVELKVRWESERRMVSYSHLAPEELQATLRGLLGVLP